MPPLSRVAFALAVLVACETSDPFESATNITAVSVGPGGGSNNMTEGTDSTDGLTTDTFGTADTADTTTTTPAPTTTSGAYLSHATDIQPIWDANCVEGCHTPGGAAATWFVLSGGAAYDSLVGQESLSFPSFTLVIPGDRDNSYLWHKINDTHFEFGAGGARMPPPPDAPLSESDRETIGQWLLEGCPP